MGKCEICGKSTKRDYSLCSDCYELFQIGEIVQCEECDTYHDIDKPCPECGIYESLPKEGFTECVLCGNKTKGHAFCKECWEEHDDEDLLEMLNDIISDRSKWEKCPDCGEIFDAFSVCDCKASKKDELTCIICGKDKNNGWANLCEDCYLICLDITKQLKRLSKKQFLEIYNETLEKVKKEPQKNEVKIKLYAIAKGYDRYHNNKELLQKIDQDISIINNPKINTNLIINNSDNLQTKENNLENIIIDKGFKCLTCGYETDGKLFCKKCYAKYGNKEILIKIKNCKEIVPLDDFYEGYFECDDGHVVKSMAERDIDDYLFSNNIKHGYEIPLPLTDDNGKKITLHPDFCIFDEKGQPIYYIEYWGYDDSNRDYTKTKKFKMPLYKKAGITLININAKHDIRNLKTNLKFKLNNYKTGIINYEDE